LRAKRSRARKQTDAEAGKKADIMRELLSKIECELPTSLVRAHTQSIINDIVRENTARGVAEEILKENERDIVASATQNARERLKGTFVLVRIAEQEGIRVTQEELFGRVATMAQRYQMSFEKMMKELQNRSGLDQIHEEMLTAKALDFLLSNASVTTAPVASATSA
jgi:trigger factor